MKTFTGHSPGTGTVILEMATGLAVCLSIISSSLAVATPSRSQGRLSDRHLTQDPEKKETQNTTQDGKSGGSVESTANQATVGNDSGSNPDVDKPQPDWPKTEDGWYQVAPEGAFASFEFPSDPKSSTRKMTAGAGKPPITLNLNVAVDENGANLVFAWHDQEEPTTMPEIAKVLDGAVKGALTTTLGELESFEPVKVGQMHACNFQIRFLFREQPMKMASRAILHRERVYQLTYVVAEDKFDESVQKRYLDSFKHLPPPPPQADPGKKDSGK